MLLKETLWALGGVPGAREESPEHDKLIHQIRVVVSRGGVDVGHVGTVFDVLIVTHDVNGIFTGLLGPVLDITRSVVLVIILNLCLGGAFNSKPWGIGWEDPPGYTAEGI